MKAAERKAIDGEYARMRREIEQLRALLERTRERYHHTCEESSECLACEVEGVVLGNKTNAVRTNEQSS